VSHPPAGTRSPSDPWQTAKSVEPAPKKLSIPGVKKIVTLRIDQDVFDFFQEDGPSWQDRINEALGKAAGLE
jgi:uncharacterized protein (DUF4415 family)